MGVEDAAAVVVVLRGRRIFCGMYKVRARVLRVVPARFLGD